jgi:hypothetical protein
MLERQNTKISISLKLGSINNGYIVQTINIVVVLPIMNLVVFYIKCWESIISEMAKQYNMIVEVEVKYRCPVLVYCVQISVCKSKTLVVC